MHFIDRIQAGRFLANCLQDYRDRKEVLILALPRGGVDVAAEVAAELNVDWDVLVVRKLGLPGHRELGVGAVAEGGMFQIQANLAEEFGVSRRQMEEVLQEEKVEMLRREWAYRQGEDLPEMAGRIVILVDDGMATGWTMAVAIESARRHGAARVVVATPVGSQDACAMVERKADEVVCPSRPTNFEAVSHYYRDFRPPSDEEVQKRLSRKNGARTGIQEREAGLLCCDARSM